MTDIGVSSTKLVRSPSSSSSGMGKSSRSLTTNFRTEEVRGYLFKKTRDGKWQKRWFETNGCFLTYYKKQGQKLLAALNLPQVGAIALLGEDNADGPGLFTIELNERVYTIKARSQDEATFWVDALLWRQAGGVVIQKSPDVPRNTTNLESNLSADEHSPSKTTMRAPKAPFNAVNNRVGNDETLSAAELKGGACGPCCLIQ